MPRFQWLADALVAELKMDDLVLDGELVCLDEHVRSHFGQLMRRAAAPIFYAFDMPWAGGD